jgi:hypothetical protein
MHVPQSCFYCVDRSRVLGFALKRRSQRSFALVGNLKVRLARRLLARQSVRATHVEG